ncbi:uncharacterized protein FIESC28_09931 [Fusarium coffeatum]|uniref:Zn(2)-C6 fungal-type domain-containing protein n=1 Tax=Fusarium coffeatum TaxID=231269 RepID=A0A366QWR8_9HYPO|nr:uncharacterized protein FIESC28_09931 [Fusarium coffeatum]RBR09323.1 hypothetical protein FIESC28_09931 [Fusarium coffeatum]
MVNRGPSRGCITCKRRRVKCDETKPSCKACNRVGRECAGYKKQPVRLRFKDETSRCVNKFKSPDRIITTIITEHEVSGFSETPGLLPSRLPKQQDAAVAFFLTYVTNVGRNMESTRGFLEFVRPILATESHNSALSAAVNATSIKLWTLLQPTGITSSLPIRLYNQALVKLQEAVYSPEEQGKDATVIAALMLQQCDTLAAIFGHNKSNTTHRKGALALLTQNGMGKFKHHGHLLGNLFHAKISFCVRHKVSLTEGELDWVQSKIIPALPANPSYSLDIIGVSISRLQTIHNLSASPKVEISLAALQELPSIICEVEAQLHAWLHTVPEIWHRQTIQAKDTMTPGIDTYDGSVVIYPSIQITNIWNMWRIYRLIVEEVKRNLFNNLVTESVNPQVKRSQETQDLIKSICRSIPFYLGNLSKPVSFTDINDQKLHFPCFHDLLPTSETFIAYKKSNHYVSRIDHNRHNVIHGPIASLSVLSSLIRLFEEHSPPLLSAEDELQRQKRWIYGQFRRSLHLMRFIPADHDETGETYWQSGNGEMMNTQLADDIRQALCTVNLL